MKKASLSIFLILFLTALQARAQQQVMPPLVHVNGIGEVTVPPTEVVISLGVETRANELDAARQQTDSKAAAIISYLKKQGVDPKNVQTSYVSLQPIYQRGEYGQAAPDFYLAQKDMTVVIKKLNNFDEIMAGLYGAGVNRVGDIIFQVEDAALEKYREEARKKAVNDAKQKAQSLTSELGAKVGRVYTINENTYGNPRPMYAKAAMMESADSAGPSIAGGQVSVISNVSISFLIEQ